MAFGVELLELVVRQQHDVDVLADDHAGCGFIGELRIVLKANRLVEGHGLVELLDRQVDEDLRGHGISPRR
jgi:hypothetical protein